MGINNEKEQGNWCSRQTEGKQERLTSHHLVAYKHNMASYIYLYTLMDLQYQQCWT